ncbi:hypothetical protein HY413_03640 [Candidatus Kaiserbacteria bacterium]|nr:hypothetical protein [Candidatus Kaiserbacteria bacterium]
MASLEQTDGGDRANFAHKLNDFTHELYGKIPVQDASDLEGDLEAAISEYQESKNTTRRDFVLREIEGTLMSAINHILELNLITPLEANQYVVRLHELGLGNTVH